eukprot:5310410-Pyramimonas_sp.AAC.1
MSVCGTASNKASACMTPAPMECSPWCPTITPQVPDIVHSAASDPPSGLAVSYTHLRAHETGAYL